MKIRNPAALGALLNGDIDNFNVANTPGGIEAQEKEGQQEFVNSETLPIRIEFGEKKEFEDMGIIFGEEVDELFVNVTLPDGWKKVVTDHDMWSHLLDDKGKIRAKIFYKAAFYDRRAGMSIPRD